MKSGILLVNLGTPDSPSTSDVRKYLDEFLNDPRVIDISPVKRWLLVNLIIVPFRSSRSAALYKKIWTDKGSPLLHYSLRQAELLRQKLGEPFEVELGMRYRIPSVPGALERLRQKGVGRIVVFPLFPQYASASTGSVHQQIMEHVAAWQVIPEIHFINSYCSDESFVHAFAEVGRTYNPSSWDHVLMSFHGLPERQVLKAGHDGCLKHADCCHVWSEKNEFCYRAQCYETARRLTAKLNIPDNKYTVCFQSRLGRSPWVKPYTDEVIRERASHGDKKMLVFAPAFTSDCLETIYEIGTEYDTLFRSLGGEKIQLVESLNDHPAWIDAMAGMIRRAG